MPIPGPFSALKSYNSSHVNEVTKPERKTVIENNGQSYTISFLYAFDKSEESHKVLTNLSGMSWE